MCNIQIKHTCNMRLKNRWNTVNRCLQHTYTTIVTYVISRSTFVKSIRNTCNIPLKHLKHLKYTIATYALKHNIYFLLRRMEAYRRGARRWRRAKCHGGRRYGARRWHEPRQGQGRTNGARLRRELSSECTLRVHKRVNLGSHPVRWCWNLVYTNVYFEILW